MKKSLQEDLLHEAITYLQAGLSIIPVGLDKKPLFSWKKYQTELPTDEDLIRWFTEYPNICGIAVVTGKISGVLVVDVEAGGDISELPESCFLKTGGEGYHFYYRFDEEKPVKNATRIRDLTDIRGEGGYAILPPSKHHSGGTYQWETPFSRDKLGEFPYWLLEEKVEETKVSIPEGKRNDSATRFLGKLLKKYSVEDWESKVWPQFVEWNKASCKPPLPEGELKSVWNSITKRERDQNEEKKEPQEVYSKVFHDGTMLETIFDPIKAETTFCVFRGGIFQKSNAFSIDGNDFVPPKNNTLILNKDVKLPSDCLSYESEIDLIRNVRNFIHRHVELTKEFEAIATYYVFLSWVYDRFSELPYLRVIGTLGSGKSRFIRVMGALCYKSTFLNGAASTAAIFRTIDDVNGVIFFDEADMRNSDTTQDVVKILNLGFQDNGVIYRTDASGSAKQVYSPRAYSVYCPKIIATRAGFDDEALESRCLTQPMPDYTRRTEIPMNLDTEFEQEALILRNQLLSFRFKNFHRTQLVRMPRLDIEPRLEQILTPLYSLFVDEQIREEILAYANGTQESLLNKRFNSFEGQILRSICSRCDVNPEPTVKSITDYYNVHFGNKYLKVSEKKVGAVISEVLGLEKVRKSDGYHLACNIENQRKISLLKKKYGIQEE